jgi:hypothetical protein
MVRFSVLLGLGYIISWGIGRLGGCFTVLTTLSSVAVSEALICCELIMPVVPRVFSLPNEAPSETPRADEDILTSLVLLLAYELACAVLRGCIAGGCYCYKR